MTLASIVIPSRGGAERPGKYLQSVLVLADPLDAVTGGGDDLLRDGHKVLPDLSRQRLDFQLQDALLVGEAVRGVDKVALCVCRGAHDVLIP